MDDHLEFAVAEAFQLATLARALQDAAIGSSHILDMAVEGRRRGEFGLIQDAQETRIVAQIIEESLEACNLPRRFGLDRLGPILNEPRHFLPERGQ